MKSFTPAEAQQQLYKLTTNLFNDLLRELQFYFECAPDADYAEAVGPYKTEVRKLRNSNAYSDKWHPLTDKLDLDKADDSEEVKIRRDFLFIMEYLRGKRYHHDINSGALGACMSLSVNTRSALFSSDNGKEWYSGLVTHICENAYGLSTLGKQLEDLAYLHELITVDNSDDAVLNFKAQLNFDKDSALNKHWTDDNRFATFLKLAYDIISCIVFPVAIARAANSKLTRGTWNFFKPDGVAYIDESNEIIAHTGFIHQYL